VSSRWRWASIGLRVALVVVAAWTLRRELADVQFAALLAQLRGSGATPVLLGLGATVASFVLLGVLELLALRYVERARVVPRPVGLLTGFVANAMSQSIGVALVTGTAVRLRAYRRYAIDAGDVARVSAFVTASVSLGLLATGAVAFLASSAPLQLGALSLPVRPVGVVLGLVVVAYLAWSILGRHEAIGRGRWRIARPTASLAVQQMSWSALDWVVTGSILWFLLPHVLGIGFATALRVYLVALTVGTLSHVPGGAGVFEALVLTLLAPVTPPAGHTAIIASLVMFRVLYYLFPLVVACAVAGIAEVRAMRPHSMATEALDVV
jgi:uncharacterized membrane protein YbhN (UPF0104 family)